ncbi:MAG: HflK protein, partial [Sutterella sp.]|nr:HflK protein [Sutterella sp.]
MSLNDPRWGRGSDEPQDKQEGRQNGQDKDERQDGSRDDRAPGNDDRRADGRDSRGQNDRDRNPEGGRREEDLDRLWGEFSDLINSIMNPGGQKRDKKDPRSQLKSRDDFSRDDEDENASGRYPRNDAPRANPAPE